MFSGIVREVGRCRIVKQGEDSSVIAVRGKLFSERAGARGESVSVSGVCLTVAHVEDGEAMFDISTETKRRTTLGGLRDGDPVNLEPALRVGDTLSGHFVLGHIDTVIHILERTEEENTSKFLLELKPEIRPFIAEKGSVSLEGVSLTIGEIDAKQFAVYIIPFTREQTTFGMLKSGSVVNVEVDVIARYLQNLVVCADEL